jgi:hypothetical protein
MAGHRRDPSSHSHIYRVSPKESIYGPCFYFFYGDPCGRDRRGTPFPKVSYGTRELYSGAVCRVIVGFYDPFTGVFGHIYVYEA